MRHFWSRAASAAVVAALLGGSPLFASSPKFFEASTQADFLKGDVENLSIDSNGRLMLGPATELVYETSAPFLWSVMPGEDGAIYIGTGNEGKVYRVDAQGKGTTFFDGPELEVHALAPAPDGGLYVATSPDGKIYKVSRDGRSSVFFDPDDKYIWSLAVDRSGNLYAGTGEKGIVYKIDRQGNGTPFYRTKATHATALAFDRGGNLLVGTGSPGRVLRVSPDGKAFVLLDSPFQEIRSIRFDDKGILYAAALSGRPSTGGGEERTIPPTPTEPARVPVPSVSAEITSISIVDVGGTPPSTGSTREDRRAAKGAVYRIAADGVWDQIWESRDDTPYDLAFASDGAVLIATGNKGKMYRLEGDPVRPTLLARASAQQVTAFYRDARGTLYYATANPGKFFRLTSDRAARGTYESEPRDSQTVSTWGTISWHGQFAQGDKAEIYTRSGNTETPDDTWSPWSSAYAAGDGSPITSPKARYLQWRAVLSGKTPVLTSITAAYLQRNLRPVVRSITVHPPGIVFQKPFSTGEPELAGFDEQTTPNRRMTSAAMASTSGATTAPSLGRRTYEKGLQTFVWKADDENDDDLVYDVLYRREGETTWQTLRKTLTDSLLVWDTTTVPNGTYFIKVVASDGPSNPVGTALTGELDSSSFQIDNTPPVILILSTSIESGKAAIAFDVKDDHSPVQRVDFSLDGVRWRGVFPKDGIADSRLEHYELVLDAEQVAHGVVLRAMDSMNNVMTTHVDVARK